MDWSNYDNELIKVYSENLFDDFLDNKLECGNLIEDNSNNYIEKDYEIKADDFILENFKIQNNNCPNLEVESEINNSEKTNLNSDIKNSSFKFWEDSNKTELSVQKTTNEKHHKKLYSTGNIFPICLYY